LDGRACTAEPVIRKKNLIMYLIVIEKRTDVFTRMNQLCPCYLGVLSDKRRPNLHLQICDSVSEKKRLKVNNLSNYKRGRVKLSV